MEPGWSWVGPCVWNRSGKSFLPQLRQGSGTFSGLDSSTRDLLVCSRRVAVVAGRDAIFFSMSSSSSLLLLLLCLTMWSCKLNGKCMKSMNKHQCPQTNSKVTIIIKFYVETLSNALLYLLVWSHSNNTWHFLWHFSIFDDWFLGLNCFEILNDLERKYLSKPYLALWHNFFLPKAFKTKF